MNPFDLRSFHFKRIVGLALAGSLGLNAVLIASGVYMVHRRGGMKYVSKALRGFSADRPLKDVVPQYEGRMASFATVDERPGQTIMVGDSITQVLEWHEVFPSSSVINRGINGDTTAGVLNRLPRYLARHPKKMFIMVGINDLNKGYSVEQVCENWLAIVRTCQAHSPATELYLQAVMPCRASSYPLARPALIRRINSTIRSAADGYGAVFVDTHTPFLSDDGQFAAEYFLEDGLHLSAQGYVRWTELLRRHISSDADRATTAHEVASREEL